jgi:hypothetical protein
MQFVPWFAHWIPTIEDVFMFRIVPLALAVAGLLTLGTLTAEAGKKKKANPNEVTGTIKATADGGKQITVAVKVKKKKKDAVPDREIKITDKTKVEYVGIEAKADQVLRVGHAVTVTVDDNDKNTATSIKVSKAGKTKKKKKTDQ